MGIEPTNLLFTKELFCQLELLGQKMVFLARLELAFFGLEDRSTSSCTTGTKNGERGWNLTTAIGINTRRPFHLNDPLENWSTRRGLNPRPSRWQRAYLPTDILVQNLSNIPLKATLISFSLSFLVLEVFLANEIIFLIFYHYLDFYLLMLVIVCRNLHK